MLHDQTIGFFGAGSMAEALVHGLLNKGVVAPGQILLTNRSNRARLASLSERYGVQTVADKRDLIRQAHVLVIACKPKDVAALMAEIGDYLREGQIILSVAAGVATETLLQYTKHGVHVVRAMPNTSCLVGESATGFALGVGASQEAANLCRAILDSVGQVVQVEEHLLDSITGLSGSGPAYIYYMVEAMVQAGIRVGLSQEVAATLALQTLKGAARMLEETKEEPSLLRQKVTSPGGTTMAGLGVLEEAGFATAVAGAVRRATERSRELGAMLADGSVVAPLSQR